MKFMEAPSISGGIYLKLKDGENVKGCFRGEIETFFVRWENKKSIPCDEGDQGAKFRFRVNFIYRENDMMVAKVWEQGTIVYNLLKDLNQEYPLEETVVIIKRTGTGLNDTSYSILPAKESKISETLESQLKQIKLHNLVKEEGFNPLEFERT